MFGLGTPELMVILVIAFLVFGGKRLPELGSGLGKAIHSFKKGLRGAEESGKELAQEVPGVKEITAVKQEKETTAVKQEVEEVKNLSKVAGK